jgi:flagellar protein FliO/FliZ
MTVRRFLLATALAVLVGAQTSAAWAAGVNSVAGGARAPVTVAHTASARHAAGGHHTARSDNATGSHNGSPHAAKSKRETGIFSAENTPLNIGTATAKKTATSSGGSSILRTVGGLLLVIGLIYAIAWVMRRVKRSREDQATGRGLQSVATLPLGGGRSLHLIRAGTDVILVGSSEHGVAPIQRYTEEEAIANGVLSEPGGEAVLHDAATTFMPDGTALPGSAPAQWRAPGGSGPLSGASIVDSLRRLTVRS